MGKIQAAIEKFLRDNPEVGECRIGREALNDPGLVRQIREGRSVREVTADKIRAWMRAYATKKRKAAKAAQPVPESSPQAGADRLNELSRQALERAQRSRS